MQVSSLIQLDVDHPHNRAVMTLPPGVSGGRLARDMERLLSDDPTLASRDWAFDLTANHEGSDNAQVDAVVAVYLGCPRTPGRKYTCVVTHDLYFALWAVSLDLRFGDRTHKTFAALASAICFLESAERP
jgi:hypothetical protein